MSLRKNKCIIFIVRTFEFFFCVCVCVCVFGINAVAQRHSERIKQKQNKKDPTRISSPARANLKNAWNGRLDTHHNDTQHNDTEHADTQHIHNQHNSARNCYSEYCLCLLSQITPLCWLSLCWVLLYKMPLCLSVVAPWNTFNFT